MALPATGTTASGISVQERAKFHKEVPNRSTWSKPPNTQYGPGQVAYNQLFFAGQDVYVFLYPYYAGKLIPIPVTGFAFGVSQEKLPIYGAWSYTWDAVAKGVRIVRGEFSIVFNEPNFISQLLGNESQSDYPQNKPLTTMATTTGSSSETARRKELRSDIWGAGGDNYLTDPERSRDKGAHTTAYPFGRPPAAGKQEAEYAGHQPFDIIVSFGNNPSMRFEGSANFDYDTWAYSAMDYVKMIGSDANEEFKPGWSSSERLHIQTVELMSVGTQYDVTGQPLQETYAFMARDVTTPKAKA